MNILGISGLPYCVPFKKKHFPYLEEKNFRIAQGFDSAAAVVTQGKVLSAAAEERFSREKATAHFPVQAIRYCLNDAKLNWSDIDCIAHGFNYESVKPNYVNEPFDQMRFAETYSRQSMLLALQQVTDYPEKKLIQVPHHLAHAASAWYLSGLPESLILVADGMGEMDSLTVALGSENQIRILMQIPALHSLGILYSVFTLYLGFEYNQDEYKVMGLAPYGDDRRYLKEVMQLVHYHSAGRFSIPILSCNTTLEDKETYRGTLSRLVDCLGPARKPSDVITSRHQDIAAALQTTLENTLIHVLQYHQQATQQTHLCMAGGVALNCVANSAIRKTPLFKRLFIQPAAGDDGTALGAALYVASQQDSQVVFEPLQMPFLGPQFDSHTIQATLDQGIPPGYRLTEFTDFNQLAQVTATKIAQGQIVALFQGRMELGPRALGNRSILADPRVATHLDKINRLIKQREDFRPLAPAVIAEQATQFFDVHENNLAEYKYMLMVATVKAIYRDQLPAVTHVDGSARVQVVFQAECCRFWKIIAEFGQITGIPVLLNTSFNGNNQPIVCTPSEAIQTLVALNLDALVIENFLLEK